MVAIFKVRRSLPELRVVAIAKLILPSGSSLLDEGYDALRFSTSIDYNFYLRHFFD